MASLRLLRCRRSFIWCNVCGRPQFFLTDRSRPSFDIGPPRLFFSVAPTSTLSAQASRVAVTSPSSPPSARVNERSALDVRIEAIRATRLDLPNIASIDLLLAPNWDFRVSVVVRSFIRDLLPLIKYHNPLCRVSIVKSANKKKKKKKKDAETEVAGAVAAEAKADADADAEAKESEPTEAEEKIKAKPETETKSDRVSLLLVRTVCGNEREVPFLKPSQQSKFDLLRTIVELNALSIQKAKQDREQEQEKGEKRAEKQI